MIGAAAIPLVLKAALPWIAASTALNYLGEEQRADARDRAMTDYNREVDTIGQRSLDNAATARRAYSAEEMDAARSADQARQLQQFEKSRLPDVDTGTIAAGGSMGARSVGNFGAGRVAAEKEQAGREFKAQLDLATLSNALFGGDIAASRAGALNRNNASLIDARRAKLETMDLPRADSKGAFLRGLGSLAGGVGSLTAANALYGGGASAGRVASRAQQSAVTRGTGPSGGRWFGDVNAPRPSVSLYSGRKF